MIEKLKHLYEMIFKLHCPECNCVMDCEGLCELIGCVCYETF